MRYRLRTLLILLAVGPLALAGGWFAGRLIYQGLARAVEEKWLHPLGRDD